MTIPIIVPTLSEYTFDAGKTAGCDTRIMEIVDVHGCGFTKTVNRGIRWALERSPEYVVILNDDAYPSDHSWLLRMITAMNLIPRVGLAGPGGLCSTLPQAFGVPYMDNDIHVVKQLAFFCVVIRTAVFRDIGLLNEDFIHYGSDNDFVLRASAAGWNSVWAQHVYVAHNHHTSSSDITKEWKEHDKKVLAEKWPNLVHRPVRRPRHPPRPGRDLARVVADRILRQGMANR